jgi:hypothetical protein
MWVLIPVKLRYPFGIPSVEVECNSFNCFICVRAIWTTSSYVYSYVGASFSIYSRAYSGTSTPL